MEEEEGISSSFSVISDAIFGRRILLFLMVDVMKWSLRYIYVKKCLEFVEPAMKIVFVDDDKGGRRQLIQ